MTKNVKSRDPVLCQICQKQLSSLEILKRHYERKHADFIKFRQEKGLYSVEMVISNIIKVHTERGHPL